MTYRSILNREDDNDKYQSILPKYETPQREEKPLVFESLVQQLKTTPTQDFKIKPMDVVKEVPGVVGRGTLSLIDTFAPAITNFTKTTGGMFGEGLAYATSKNVREQYKAGNLDILPYVSNTKQKDILKATFAAGLETSVYKFIPKAVTGSLATRGGIGALQGLGFAISEGIARDQSAEEIVKNAGIYGAFGGVMGTLAPYIVPILKADLKKLTPEVKNVFKSLYQESTGTPLSQTITQKGLQQAELPPSAQKLPPEEQAFVKEKVAKLRQEPPAQTTPEVHIAKEGTSIQKIFHGSASEFDQFDILKAKANSNHGEGIYFSDNRKLAEYYSTIKTKGVDLANASVEDLANLKTRIGNIKEVGLLPSAKIKNMPDNPSQKLIDQAKVDGFDGVKFKDNVIKEDWDPKVLGEMPKNGNTTLIFNPKVIVTNQIHKQTPISKTTTPKGFSKHYEQIKGNLGGMNDFVEYTPIKLKEQAKKAFNYIEKSPEDALRVAYGFQDAPKGINANAIRTSLVESLKSAGKMEQARAIAKRLSLEITKSAQDLNIAKLDLGSAGQRKIEAAIMNSRLEKIGRNIPEKTPGTKTPAKTRALNKIKADAKVASKEVLKKTTTAYKSADDLIKALTC